MMLQSTSFLPNQMRQMEASDFQQQPQMMMPQQVPMMNPNMRQEVDPQFPLPFPPFPSVPQRSSMIPFSFAQHQSMRQMEDDPRIQPMNPQRIRSVQQFDPASFPMQQFDQQMN